MFSYNKIKLSVLWSMPALWRVTVKWNHCPCFDQNETEIAENIYHLAFEEDFARAEASGPNLIKLLKALYTFGNYSKYIILA